MQTKDSNASSQKPAAGTDQSEKAPKKRTREIEAERLLQERRANAQSLLINLAADARTFDDMRTRGRTLARSKRHRFTRLAAAYLSHFRQTPSAHSGAGGGGDAG